MFVLDGVAARLVVHQVLIAVLWYCLLLCEIFDFRKVYWSPRSVCLLVCPGTLQHFFFENRIKGKVKVITFVKIRQWAITFQLEVAETSGWLQNVPYRTALLHATVHFDVRRHLFASCDFKENEKKRK